MAKTLSSAALAALFLMLSPVLLFRSPSALADIDADRPFLEKLQGKEPGSQVSERDFEYPFLIAETVRVFPKSPAIMGEVLRSYLKRDELPFRAHFSKSGVEAEKIDGERITLPEVVRTGKQLQGIEKCSESYCLMKLLDSEKKQVQAATDKVSTFRGIIAARLRLFLQDHELKGYERRKDGNKDVLKMLPLLHFLKARYPTSIGYLEKGFWRKEAPPKTFKGSFFREELVNISDDKLQPIWRIGEALEFQENNATLFVELFPYSDHYLDSSLRVYEVLPQGEQSLLSMTDVMEVDELTKSGVIRLLYKGKMESAVVHVQNEELNNVPRG